MGLSTLPFFFVAMAVADGIERTDYFNIITAYLNIITNYLYMWVNMSFDIWSNGLNASKAQNY